MHLRKNGFTLIELSIVLVIIGLVIGGVLVGQELIKGAQLRAVISEQEKLVAAANAFRTKYNCKPGDCANASQFFGQAATCNGAVTLTATSGTCNGSGDGQVCSPADANCENNVGEHLFIAHHLMLSNLILFKLNTPVNTAALTYVGFPVFMPGQNIFESTALKGMGWMLRSMQQAVRVGTSFNLGATHYCGSYPTTQNWIYLGGASINSPLGANNVTTPGASFMNSNDAFSIDAKMDDGKPATGYVISPYYSATSGLVDGGSGGTCDAAYQATAKYNQNITGTAGGLVFLANF